MQTNIKTMLHGDFFLRFSGFPTTSFPLRQARQGCYRSSHWIASPQARTSPLEVSIHAAQVYIHGRIKNRMYPFVVPPPDARSQGRRGD